MNPNPEVVARGRSCRFLLGEAVEGAQAPDQVDGVDADDFAVGEAAGDDVEGVAVVAGVEGGGEDERVGDVGVGVAGGGALAFGNDGRGHGGGGDLEGFVVWVCGAAEAVEGFGGGRMVVLWGVA